VWLLCDGDGVKGQALQCDLCDGWFHALCENMSNKQYKSFSCLAKFVPNMLYLCSYNKCHLRLKRIIGEFAGSSADKSEKLSESIKSALQRHGKSLVSTLTGHIGKCIEDVGMKIENLISNQSGLQEEFDSISRSLQDSFVSNARIAPSTPHTCSTIVEELVEEKKYYYVYFTRG